MSAAAVSEGERRYILAGVAQGIRSDGRSRLDFRDISIETGMLPQANGSARVTLCGLGGATDVVAGVKASVTQPDPSSPGRGRILVAVDCLPLSDRGIFGARDRRLDDLATELSQTLEEAFDRSAGGNLEALCIVPGRSCWTLNVDVQVIGTAGNLRDAIFLAASAALRSAEYPEVEVDEEEGEIAVNEEAPLVAVSAALAARLPLSVTLYQMRPTTVGDNNPVQRELLLVDASVAEEACACATVTVSVNAAGRVCSVHKGGAGGLAPAALFAALQAAHATAKTLHAAVESALAREREADRKRTKFAEKMQWGFLARAL
jgi:exosome complex component RRP42